ncbi:hypothetical protein DER46DRAFT_615823 [Fusarium sp. MPI-SDFR-AT-0072]|nr:hypothetical protein DER46DRAFT_615823 [Fusarium sp. MPI-SDFR-AT-0072]
MQTHSNERPHKCTFGNCEAAFKTKSDLKKHMDIHLDQRREHKCRQCGFVAPSQWYLKVHKKEEHRQ